MTHEHDAGLSVATRHARLIIGSALAVLGVLLAVSLPALAFLYLNQTEVLNQRIVQEGNAVLDAFIAQSRVSIEKGQPQTFQRILDDIARLESVESTALYSRNGLMTYRSGGRTVGYPFLRVDAAGLSTEGAGDVGQHRGRRPRSDWNVTDLAGSAVARPHVEQMRDRYCHDCHVALDPRASFTPDGRAQLIEQGRSSFFYRLSVEGECVMCHTHWRVGEVAGFLAVEVDDSAQRSEVMAGIRRVLYVLLAIGAIVLAATVIIAGMYGQLRERRLALAEKSGKLGALLDNSGQGFLSFDDTLTVDAEHSRECVALLGQAPAGQPVAALLYPGDADAAKDFARNLARIMNETQAYKRDMYLSLMPRELARDGKHLRLEYRPLEARRLMLVISDITRQKALEAQIEHERRHLRLIVAAAREPADFFELLGDFERFRACELPQLQAQPQVSEQILAEVYRRIHTFKGLSLQLDFITFPARLHQLESMLAAWRRHVDDIDHERMDAQLSYCAEGLEDDLAVVREALGEAFFDKRGEVTLSAAQVQTLERLAGQLLAAAADDAAATQLRVLLQALQTLRHVDFRTLLEAYPAMVAQLAAQLDKEVMPVEIHGDAVRVDPERYQPFTKSLVHLFRNAIDHGIEDPETRLEAGKNEAGTITCTVTAADGAITLCVEDDGSGIDVAAVRRKGVSLGLFDEAQARSLPEEALLATLFADAFSTREAVTDLSGRGVGLAAVRVELARLGGRVEVATTAGAGTRFTFSLPYEQGDAYGIFHAHSRESAARATQTQ